MQAMFHPKVTSLNSGHQYYIIYYAGESLLFRSQGSIGRVHVDT